MPSLNRLARILTLVLLTCVAFASASSVSVQGKASWSRENPAARMEYPQDPYRIRPTPLPLINWLARANDLKSRGLVDLNSSAEFTVEAKLNSDCRLSDIVVSQKSGDRSIVRSCRKSGRFRWRYRPAHVHWRSRAA
jgi:hypothetical protein